MSEQEEMFYFQSTASQTAKERAGHPILTAIHN